MKKHNKKRGLQPRRRARLSPTTTLTITTCLGGFLGLALAHFSSPALVAPGAVVGMLVGILLLRLAH